MKWVFDDGGRSAAGFKGTAGDCACRAIAIATGVPYAEVYDAINAIAKTERKSKRRRGTSSARTGVHKGVARKVLADYGWKWVPTMHIGSGCKVHLHDGELPNGRLVVSVSKHYTAVIDGVIHDIYDPQREVHWHEPYRGQSLKPGQWVHDCGDIVCWITRRCVYGYWMRGSSGEPPT